MSTDQRAVDPSGGLDVLLGHPLAARLARLGQRVREFDAVHPWALDTAVVAAIMAVFCLPDLLHRDVPQEVAVRFTPVPVAATLALQAGLVVPLWWRRRSPAVVFHTITAVVILQWSLGVLLRADVGALVALYSLVLHGRLRSLVWAIGPGLVAVALISWRVSAAVSIWDALFFMFSAATAAAAIGFAVRIRRAQLAVLRERAVRLEIERDQRSMLAAAEERTRIARETHDIVGHSLSVIITLADGGAYASQVAPERGREALELIAATGRQALGELRRLLGVLRDEAEEPHLSPQPQIADIAELCDRIRAAGPEVSYRSAGNVDALDVGVQLAAYRIVQEALTNTLKHAGPATRILLRLAGDERQLRVVVADTGPPGGGDPDPSFRDGHGLVGMGERAALYGGTVLAGPAPGGGWAVQANLKLHRPSEDPA